MAINTGNHNYYVYIITNAVKTVLYIGVTNSVAIRMAQHKEDALGEKKTFAGRYNCYYLLYAEHFTQIAHAIAREKELKGWTRARKEALINTVNPDWTFLNSDL